MLFLSRNPYSANVSHTAESLGGAAEAGRRDIGADGRKESSAWVRSSLR